MPGQQLVLGSVPQNRGMVWGVRSLKGHLVPNLHCGQRFGLHTQKYIKHTAEVHEATRSTFTWMLPCSSVEAPGEKGGGCAYPPVLGAHDQERALREGAEGNALAVLAVDGLGLLLEHGCGVLNQREPALTNSSLRTEPVPRQARGRRRGTSAGATRLILCTAKPSEQFYSCLLLSRSAGVPSGHLSLQQHSKLIFHRQREQNPPSHQEVPLI